jgi:hypothetical protein
MAMKPLSWFSYVILLLPAVSLPVAFNTMIEALAAAFYTALL